MENKTLIEKKLSVTIKSAELLEKTNFSTIYKLTCKYQ